MKSVATCYQMSFLVTFVNKNKTQINRRTSDFKKVHTVREKWMIAFIEIMSEIRKKSDPEG